MSVNTFSRLKIPALVLLAGLIFFNFTRLTAANLHPDEAYYWEAAQHLTLNFEGNSPLTAWLIRFFTKIGGNNLFAVRFPALLIWSLLMWLIPQFTKAVYQDETAAAFGLIIALFTPFAFSSPLTTPGLLVVAGSLPAWYFGYRAIEEDRPAAWYGWGVFSGLAVLAGFEAVLIGLSIVLMLLLRPSKWKLLGRKDVYLGLLLWVLIVIPFGYWNWRYGGSGLTESHLARPDGSILSIVSKQLGSALFRDFTLLGLALIYYTLKRLITFRRTTGGEYFLIYAIIPPLLYWVATSLAVPGQTPETLPLVVYLPALIFVAGQLYQGLQQPGVVPKLLLTTLIVANLGLNGISFAANRTPRLLRQSVFSKLPAVLTTLPALESATQGWAQLGRTVDRLVKASFPETSLAPIVADSPRLAAELNYYVTVPADLLVIPGTVRSHYDSLTAQRASQFDRQPGLLVLERPFAETGNTYFSQVKLLETVKRTPASPIYIYRFEALPAADLKRAAEKNLSRHEIPSG